MPSYKKHLLFSLLISLLAAAPFLPNVFYLALALVGASIVDLDHPVRNRNLLLLASLGLILTTVLYMLKIPLVMGLTLILMALIFFISSHRGLMHSITGVIIISVLLALFTSSTFLLLVNFSVALVPSLAIILVILGLIILNKQIVPFYVVVALLGIFLIPYHYFNPYYVFLAFLIGSMSHIALDMFTGSGVKLFSPFIEKKFGKKTVFILSAVWVMGIVWFYW